MQTFKVHIPAAQFTGFLKGKTELLSDAVVLEKSDDSVYVRFDDSAFRKALGSKNEA